METLSALLALCAGNSPVPENSQHKGQWRGALMFSLICARIINWVNNREAGDLRRHRDHYDVSVMVALYLQLTSLRMSNLEWIKWRHISVMASLITGNPIAPMTFSSSTQRARSMESISMWWHHHGPPQYTYIMFYRTLISLRLVFIQWLYALHTFAMCAGLCHYVYSQNKSAALDPLPLGIWSLSSTPRETLLWRNATLNQLTLNSNYVYSISALATEDTHINISNKITTCLRMLSYNLRKHKY